MTTTTPTGFVTAALVGPSTRDAVACGCTPPTRPSRSSTATTRRPRPLVLSGRGDTRRTSATSAAATSSTPSRSSSRTARASRSSSAAPTPRAAGSSASRWPRSRTGSSPTRPAARPGTERTTDWSGSRRPGRPGSAGHRAVPGLRCCGRRSHCTSSPSPRAWSTRCSQRTGDRPVTVVRPAGRPARRRGPRLPRVLLRAGHRRHAAWRARPSRSRSPRGGCAAAAAARRRAATTCSCSARAAAPTSRSSRAASSSSVASSRRVA